MPATARHQKAPAPKLGRPKRDHPPRRKMSLLIDEDIIEWLNANLRRDVYVSDIVNDALRKFARLQPPDKKDSDRAKS